MTPRSELRPLLRLAGPIALAHMAQMAMQLVDTMFVGRLGAEALGGVAVAQSVFVVVSIVSLGLLLGIDFLVSFAYGAGKLEECHHYLVQALYLATFVSVPCLVAMHWAPGLFHLFGVPEPVAQQGAIYLRTIAWSLWPMLLFVALRQFLQAVGVATPVTLLLILANGVNALGNWLFIFGNAGAPELGVAGSAMATVFARWFLVGGCFGVVVWRARSLKFDLGGVALRVSRESILKLVKLGAPAALQILFEVGVFALSTLLAGKLGTMSLAAHQVVLQVASFTFMVPLGVSSAAAVLVGQRLGQKRPVDAVASGWIALKLGALVMAVSGLSLYLGSGSIMRIFTADEGVIDIGRKLLLIAAIFQLADGVQVVSSGVLRGIGNTRIAALVNLVGHWGMGLPLGLALGFGMKWGIQGIWVGLSTGLIAVALALIVTWKMKSRELLA